MSSMRITYSFFISLFIILVFTPENASPQIVKTSSKFKPAIMTVEILANFAQPLPNLYGDVADFFSFKNYGVTYGFGSQVNVKISANKKGTVRPYLSIGYALFLGKDNNTAFIDSNTIAHGYPLPDGQQYKSTPGESRIFLHDYYAGLGLEYAFVNKTRWTPVLGADLDLNVLFGTYRQTPNVSTSGTSGEISFTIKSAARFGFSVGGGLQARFGKVAGIVFSAKYKFANLLGKNAKVINEVNKMDLLDKAATELNTSLSKDRQINYLEFGIGVVFYVGKR